MSAKVSEFDSLVAICRGCGALRAAYVDDPAHARDIAKEAAGWIRNPKLRVERMTTPEVRAANWKCSCAEQEKQQKAAIQPGLELG